MHFFTTYSTFLSLTLFLPKGILGLAGQLMAKRKARIATKSPTQAQEAD